MTPKPKSVTEVPKGKKSKPNVIIQGDVVRVWSEVGVTVAVTDDPPQFLRFLFGHERIAKNSTQEEIRRTANLIDEFNEGELERRLKKYVRILLRGVDDDEDDETPARKKKGGESVKDRVRKRVKDS